MDTSTSSIDSQRITTFQHTILSWYAANQRQLPWRETREPYHILVSEVMLQQTQVNRVIDKYTAWFQHFPNVEVLASAPMSEVLIQWSGLGYNRRAIFLQKTAQAVVSEYKGIWPSDIALLEKLPGIGAYTSRALACFSFDMQVPVIDTNIRKVIAVHFFNGILPDNKTIEAVATELLPQGKAYEWNQALMDYASAELKHHKIPIPKQSPFLGSNRYYRGTTLKQLVAQKSQTIDQLLSMFANRHPITKENYERILQTMEKEGMIVRVKDTIMLPKC